MADLRLYNSLTRQIAPFTPLEPGKVRLYNCGPTVHKRQHIGNMRRYLFSDLLRRTLESFGYEVRDITNITDVGHLTQDEIDAGEDKLEQEARHQKMTPQAIADKQIKLFAADRRELNIEPAHKYPRATEHIKAMQQLIGTLLQKGFAYRTPSGVYFSVESFPNYGKLSGHRLEDLSAGARVAVRDDKKHPADFALWKVDPNHLQKWDSPWGVGYPGWHIECSAMSLAYLGPEIDIHTGGEDNRFPHHENEIAQSEAATGQPFVRWWMHNAHVRLQGKKMAKREGTPPTLDDLTDRGYPLLSFRWLVFSVHYRHQLDFSWEVLTEAAQHVASLKNLLRRLHEHHPDVAGKPDTAVIDAFQVALADDLNTPRALAVVLEYMHTLNTTFDKNALATLHALDAVLGIVRPLEQELASEKIPAEVDELAQQREVARQAKNFSEADRLRLAIEQKGYAIEDTPEGPRLIKL